MSDTQTAQAHDEAVEEMAKWLFSSRVKNGADLWRWLPDERQDNHRTEAKALLETAMTAMAKRGFTMQPTSKGTSDE